MNTARYLYPLVCLLGVVLPARGADIPPWLPTYDVKVSLDVAGHQALVRQQVTWTNRHGRPTDEIVFNVHSNYEPPSGSIDRLFLAKMLEIMRVPSSEGIPNGKVFDLKNVSVLVGTANQVESKPLAFGFHAQQPTTLIVKLPQAIRQGESVTLTLDFYFHLPPKQGRWGQWKGVTFLSNWLPVVSVYDEEGWHPVPFVPWHQPWYNEAGVYNVRVELPETELVACTGTQRERPLKDGRKEVTIGPVVARDFALLTSARYKEYSGRAGKVKIKVMAFEEHAHYAEKMCEIVATAILNFSKWFGPFPYPEFTIAESYFGWNGNECSDLVMIDERVFDMPKIMEGYAEYLLTHETCHQWWYNLIGTDGFHETWMDEAMATHFAHRLMNQEKGKNNSLLKLPEGLGWLPNIKRDDYRFSSFYTTLHRGELKPPVTDMPKFGNVANLFSSAYDRGSLVVAMIEERLGEVEFLRFTQRIYQKYCYRILKVQDYRRELEEFTGRDWKEFFDRWLYGTQMSDWSVESVKVEKVQETEGATKKDFLKFLKKQSKGEGLHRVTVVLHQKAELDEMTNLGFSFDDGQSYVIRVPVAPSMGPMQIPDPPGEIEALPNHRIKIDLLLPARPTQIAVDPDQIMPDSNPRNNFWKPKVKLKVTPVYTFLDETNLTASYDSLNIIAGPWIYSPTYNDPWFNRATVFGLRIGALKVEDFSAGAYIGYRSDFRDLAVGMDALKKNVLPKFDVGIHAEKAIADFGDGGSDLDRAVLYGRYIITQASSLYTVPMQYAEMFASYQRNFLPEPKYRPFGSRRIDTQTQAGFHYHLDFLTPYWDPEVGFRLDVTYAAGFPIFNAEDYTHQATAQFSWVWKPPESLGYLSKTKFAFRGYSAMASPTEGEFYSLGGNLLFRGFDLAERQGSKAWIGSMEWRVPVVCDCHYDVLDHVAGLRNLYVVPFYDVGEIYSGGNSVGGVAHALGVGLRADVSLFSFIERTTLRLDVAKTVNAATPFQFWIGVSNPF